jgi:hypothetical protein
MTSASRPLKLLRKSTGSTPKNTRRRPVKLSMGERACFAEGKLNEQLREKGRAEGMRKAIRILLEVRFQVVPSGLIEELGLVREMERLEALHRHAIRCASLEEFAAGL